MTWQEIFEKAFDVAVASGNKTRVYKSHWTDQWAFQLTPKELPK